MQRFIQAIQASLQSENWYAALYLALTLPDICARLESSDGKTSADRYAAWFDRYLRVYYVRNVGGGSEPHVFLSGNDCYALRCAILHEGASDISNQRKREALKRFHFTVLNMHCNQINTTLQLDIPTFCGQICDAVDHWLKDFLITHPNYQDRLKELLTIYDSPHTVEPGFLLS